MRRTKIAAPAFAFFLLVSMVAPFFVGGALAAATIVDDFEDGTYQDTWTEETTGAYDAFSVTGTSPIEGSNSLEYFANGSTPHAIQRTFTSDAYDTLSWKINYATVSTSTNGYFYVLDSNNGNQLIQARFNNGSLEYYDGVSWSQIGTGTISSGTDYKITTTYHYSTDTWDVEVVNEGTGSTAISGSGLAFQQSASQVGAFKLQGYGDAFTFDFLATDGAQPLNPVSGTVEDNAGNALANVSVEATQNGTVIDSATTDGAGAYALDLPDGDYTVTASKAGYVDSSQAVTVTGATSGIDFALTPEDSTIVGSVEDQDANPKAHVDVEAWSGGSLIAETTTDGSGSFSFAVGNGTYTIRAKAANYANAEKTNVSVDTTANATDVGAMVITRLGPYEQGLYSEMNPVVTGNFSEADLEMTCRTDPDGILQRGFAAFWGTDAQTVAGCEPDYTGATQVDMLEAAASHNQSEQELLIVMSNRLEDARGIAYTKGKIAAVEAMNRGENQTVAKQEAREAIEDYYATLETNVYSRWSTSSAQADYIRDTMVDSDEGDWIYGEPAAGGADVQFDGKVSATVTLSNNETIAITTYQTANGVVVPEPSQSASSAGTLVGTDRIVVYGPGKNASTTIANADRFGSLLTSIETQENQTKGNVATLVSTLYNEYDQDEIDTSKLIDPVELGTEASTDYNSTGFYSYAAAQLSALGYGGDINASHVIEIQTVNGTETVEGSLYYTGDDLTSLETGKTYQPANYNGSFMIATADGIREISDPFTVTEATDVTSGESMTTTSLEGPTDYGTADSTNFAQLVDELSALRSTYDNLSTSTVGGGGSLGGVGDLWDDFVNAIGGAFGLDSGTAAIVAMAAVGGVVYVAVVRD